MNLIKLLTPQNWVDYELIDCGNGKKMERFGEFITIRPEPQALWNKQLSEKEWSRLAHVTFEQKGSHSDFTVNLMFGSKQTCNLFYLFSVKNQELYQVRLHQTLSTDSQTQQLSFSCNHF